MAKVIEFYVPKTFPQLRASQPGGQPAKIIEFRSAGKKSA